jgi:hypothetical protein
MPVPKSDIPQSNQQVKLAAKIELIRLALEEETTELNTIYPVFLELKEMNVAMGGLYFQQIDLNHQLQAHEDMEKRLQLNKQDYAVIAQEIRNTQENLQQINKEIQKLTTETAHYEMSAELLGEHDVFVKNHRQRIELLKKQYQDANVEEKKLAEANDLSRTSRLVNTQSTLIKTIAFLTNIAKKFGIFISPLINTIPIAQVASVGTTHFFDIYFTLQKEESNKRKFARIFLTVISCALAIMAFLNPLGAALTIAVLAAGNGLMKESISFSSGHNDVKETEQKLQEWKDILPNLEAQAKNDRTGSVSYEARIKYAKFKIQHFEEKLKQQKDERFFGSGLSFILAGISLVGAVAMFIAPPIGLAIILATVGVALAAKSGLLSWAFNAVAAVFTKSPEPAILPIAIPPSELKMTYDVAPTLIESEVLIHKQVEEPSVQPQNNVIPLIGVEKESGLQHHSIFHHENNHAQPSPILPSEENHPDNDPPSPHFPHHL